MEIAFQILEKLPPGWSRIVVVLVMCVLFFLPELRRKATFLLREQDRFDRAKALLELRRLEIEVEEMKARHPEFSDHFLDREIRTLLDEPPKKTEPEPIGWTARLRNASAGSFALMVLGTMALAQSGKFTNESPVKVLLVELGYTAVCAVLAASIPSRRAWESVFRGFLIPAILGGLVAAAKG